MVDELERSDMRIAQQKTGDRIVDGNILKAYR
jgi:hypothetical protein